MNGPWAANPLFEHSFTKPEVRQATAAMTREFPGAEYLATQRDRVEREWSLPDRLSELDLPTVVLVGEKETPGFRAYAEEAAERITGASLEVLEDCGHMVPLEEPENVAQAIIDISTR